MPTLVPPTTDVHASFLEAVAESRADPMYLLGVRFTDAAGELAAPGRFAAYVESLRADALEEAARPAGHVPATILWLIDGADFLGRLSIRHRLTPQLLELGGHIGYGVRPSARRRGHATQMLLDAMPVSCGLGINPALVTCDADNLGSRKVIEAVIKDFGGWFEDRRGVKLRFWVATSRGDDGGRADR
jgi:predicted acetyltransferase